MVANSQCPASRGIFPIKGDCVHYITCIGGRAYRKTCPEGFYFDTIRHCTPDEAADCGVSPYDSAQTHNNQRSSFNPLRSADRNDLCPQSYGVFPYPPDCRKYIICVGGQGRIKNCPEGHVFFDNVGCIESHACPSDLNLMSAVSEPKPEDEVCGMKPDVGTCDGALERYYYDRESGRCKKFIYGGCGGNGNNFYRKDECMVKCGGALEKDVCELPREVGPCQASLRRFYYDRQSETCQEFTYSGCGGNRNNFYTVQECMTKCEHYEPHPDKDVCTLPYRPGPCRAAFPRFYYNSETGKCEKFIYGGCRSNGNNFETEDECLRKCSPKSDKVRDYQCQENGRFTNPNSCESYIECYGDTEGFQLTIKRCPSGQQYNNRTQMCDYSCSERCEQNLDCACMWPHCLITCDEPNGLFPVPWKCHLYLECKNNRPSIHRCPDGEAFDNAESKCVPNEEINCQEEKRDLNDIMNIMRN